MNRRIVSLLLLRSRANASLLIALSIGALATACAAVLWGPATPTAIAQNKESDKPTPTIASLAADVEVMKGKLPGQAHVMMDVAYHFSNLYFAAQRGNWPLAEFYFNETRSHLRWAVRIIPIRKDNQGKEVKLAEILQAVENGPLKQLEAAVKGKDREQFVKAYDNTLVGCYACHKAADKPYLALKIPDHPAEALIDFTPSSSSTPAAENPAGNSSKK